MLTIKDVEKVQNLSKLSLNDEEKVEMQTHLNGVFEYMNILNDINLEDVEPLFNVHEYTDKFRMDTVNNSLSKKDFLNDSPIKDEDFIVVPKIVE